MNGIFQLKTYVELFLNFDSSPICEIGKLLEGHRGHKVTMILITIHSVVKANLNVQHRTASVERERG